MANQYTSYYLYQKYEKRGSQDWLPCYPNIFSVDGDGTMPLVIKTVDDPECGYTPPVEPIYRWYNIPITTDYICDTCPAVQYRWVNKDINHYYQCIGTSKYYVQKEQYSIDGGSTWSDVVPEETQTGSLYEMNSQDCGYVPPIEPQYRTTSGTPYCTGYDKYVDVYSQVSYDGGSTWSTTATTATLVEANSPDCGYIPPGAGVITYTAQTKLMEMTLYEKSSLAYIENYIANDVFSGTSGQLTITSHTFENGVGTITFNDRVVAIGVMAFSFCDITGIDIPSGVTSIDSYAFAGCNDLTSVVIPNSVTSIGNSAFYGCSGLDSATIGSGVTNIGTSAFLDCDSLRSIDIPDSVISIGDAAFENCGYLTSATIGSGITSIGDYAFESCGNLPSITIKATNPPTLGINAFLYSSISTIYVPAGSVSAYKSAPVWNYGYADMIQPIP